jgi:hypothetical protein
MSRKVATARMLYRGIQPGGSHIARYNIENSKQLFPEEELRSLSPNFYIHVSVSDFYFLTIGPPILPQENMCTDPGNI